VRAPRSFVAAGGVASPAAPGPANGRIVFGKFGRLIASMRIWLYD